VRAFSYAPEVPAHKPTTFAIVPSGGLFSEQKADAAAFSMAVTKAIAGMTSLAGDGGHYLSSVLKDGLHDLEGTDYQNIAADRRDAFRDNVKARYIELVTEIK
jgi:hypothetical protein